MKPFLTALCVLCFTAVFASAEEPELIERPLTWTIDSIQIVWNIEEKQTENYEWRSISDRSKSSSVDDTNLSKDTNTTTDTSSEHFSGDTEVTLKGGIGFERGLLANLGLYGSAGMSAGLGWKREDINDSTKQNEWVKSENTSSKVTESEDTSAGNQTIKYNRKLLFTVNFVNHTEDALLLAPDAANTIPVYCGNDHIGNARPVITTNEIFRIPATQTPYPCQFEMDLNDSSKTKLLQSVPDIRILGSQIKIFNDEYDDAFTQSFKTISHFTVRLTADGASRDWEFRYNKKNKYDLLAVLDAINEDCEVEDVFEFNEDGSILSVAGFPVQPSKDTEAFVLFAWNGEPVTDLKDLKPHKNSILDVILVSRALLETRQSTPLTTLKPFYMTLFCWESKGLIDGKYLNWNLVDEDSRKEIIETENKVRKSAEQGDAKSQKELGDGYSYGFLEKDQKEAVKWYRKAAEQGDASGQVALGDCYLHGTGVEKDEKEAVNWFRKAADQGDASGQISLGYCYLWGDGVEKDEKEAVSLFRKAAEQGDASGQECLALRYESGEGVEKDEKEAVKWYRKAAEQGSLYAEISLGNCYKDGIGVERDGKEAVKWYRKAAEQGNSDAEISLGNCYKDGIGVERDEKEAVKWYRKAAEQGNSDAEISLGNCYKDGIGVERDEKEAVKWYRKAAEWGKTEAQEKLKELGY